MTQRIQSSLTKHVGRKVTTSSFLESKIEKTIFKSRNLEHYINQQEYFNDEMNKYWFYFTIGGGSWKKHKPVPINKPKSVRRLSLSRW